MTDEPTNLADYAVKKGNPWFGLGNLLSGSQDSKQAKTLQAISNVIELKPDGKYLLVFKGDFTREQLAHALTMIKATGIQQIVAIVLHGEQELEVIEVPGVEKATLEEEIRPE